MDRSTYLSDQQVQAFVDWAANLVTGKWGLVHGWCSQRLESRGCRQFECRSLFEAYTRYCWPGTVTRADGSSVHVKSFDETAAIFDELREELRYFIVRFPAADQERDRFLSTCIRIREWGGINRHDDLKRLGRDALPILRANARLLEPKHADTDRLKGFKYMKAGYSKIYSLIIDGFPIYDSRTACGLTSLIWLFSKDNGLEPVPGSLRLAVPEPRGTQNRNPYAFPFARHGQGSLYADSNVKAAWILGALAEIGGEFGALPPQRRLLALQSSLFMIGYEPLKRDAVRRG